MSEVEKLVERLKAVLPKMIGTLPVCPFDRRSPDYWTTSNDKPCHVCGGTEAVDKCRGADLRCMDEASDAMREAATTLQSQARRVEELEGARDEAREIAKRVPQLEFELRAKNAELEIADGEIERLRAVEIELRKALVPEGYNDVAARSALSEGSGSSRELAPPDESGDACGATERAE